MRKILTFIVLSVFAFGMVSCNKDEAPKVPVLSDYWTMPSTDFGKPLVAISSAEQAKGASVTNAGVQKIKVSRTIDDIPFTWEYFGDPSGEYRFAKCLLPDGIIIAELTSHLISLGYSEVSDYSKDATVKVMVNNTEKLFVTICTSSTKALGDDYFLFGPIDESIYSWTRMSDLKSQVGMITPLMGYYARPELIKNFAQRMGYTVHKNTDESKGFYFYETGDTMFPALAFWLDEEYNEYLVEARLYFDSSNKPSVSDLTDMLKEMGYHYTYSLDPEDDSQIFFDYENKKTIYVAYDAQTLPCIKFTPDDLENNLPPLKVDFPWLPTEVYQKTTQEVVDWVKKQSWYESQEEDYLDVWPMFKTKYPEFPYVVILDDNGDYGAGIIFAETSLALRALSIRETITGTYGCVYKEGSALYPTFLNNDATVPYEFQYVFDAGMWGYPALIIEPQ